MTEQTEDSCYKGQNPNKWQHSVKEIIDRHKDLFPIILEKGGLEQWKKVHLSER